MSGLATSHLLFITLARNTNKGFPDSCCDTFSGLFSRCSDLVGHLLQTPSAPPLGRVVTELVSRDLPLLLLLLLRL